MQHQLHQASGLRSAQSCEALKPTPAIGSLHCQTAVDHAASFLTTAAAREERATSTVLPSSQQAATSTSDLLDACGGDASYSSASGCVGVKHDGCQQVVWQCRTKQPEFQQQQQQLVSSGSCGVGLSSHLRSQGTDCCAPLPAQHSHQIHSTDSPDTAESQADICRICHCPDNDPSGDNPLISPCLCSGSLKYVHRDCLQHWVKSQDIKVCELCKFGFVMRVTTKPISEWRKLDMSSLERRKIICSVSFHIIALTCVIWSLYVLIEKTSAEINSGKLEWPFWTKLVVVAIGFTGGTVFMYVQCRTYFGLCRRWRSFNRTFLIQSASEEELSRARALAKARPPRRSSDYCSDELV